MLNAMWRSTWDVPGREKGFSLELIIIGLIVLTTGALIATLWFQKTRAENKYKDEVAAHATTRAQHSEAVALAANETLRAERAERAKEEIGRSWTKEQNEKDTKRSATYQIVVADRGVQRKQLRDHITNLTNRVVASESSAKPGAACGDLQEKLSALGLFFERVEGTASRCAETYGEIRNDFESSVDYANQVRPKNVD